MSHILLLVDPQIDFINGSLPVPGAETAMSELSGYLKEQKNRYDEIIITYDYHPWSHCSFSANGGQWPRHCVQMSAGAAIWPRVLESLYECESKITFLPKGQVQDKEEYSIFKTSGGKEYILKSRADCFDICGIAGDICVLNTLKDGIGLLGGDKFRVLHEFSPSLDGGKALREFAENL